MSLKNDGKRLLQEDSLSLLTRQYNLDEYIPVYLSEGNATYNRGMLAALVSEDRLDPVMDRISWSFSEGDGYPGAAKYWENGAEQVEYLRYGNDEGIEPIVIHRDFFGFKETLLEISEEFRLFHNLFHNIETGKYFKLTDTGEELLVAELSNNLVKIRLKELRQFIAVKEMYLLIQFDYREFSSVKLADMGLKESNEEHSDLGIYWNINFGDLPSYIGKSKSFSRLLGKRVIKPLPKSKSGFWGFAEDEKKFEEYVLGTTQDGDEVKFTCNPDKLSNYFDESPEAPHHLTPVSFNKEVLGKYYQHPNRYTVEDSMLRCGHLWSLEIDNHHDEKVCAWLGDLGQSLPHAEQLHWKAHNITSATGVSDTYFNRQILNNPLESEQPEHQFQKQYSLLQQVCDSILGWPILLPLDSNDQYHLENMRVPTNDGQPDFDQFVLSLSKILVDSLNQKKFRELIPGDEREGKTNSIQQLAAVFEILKIDNSLIFISFLRDLQEIRSSGSAHRKGKNYRKAIDRISAGSKSLRDIAKVLMGRSVDFLQYVTDLVESHKFNNPCDN